MACSLWKRNPGLTHGNKETKITQEDFVTFNHMFLVHRFSVRGFKEFDQLFLLCGTSSVTNVLQMEAQKCKMTSPRVSSLTHSQVHPAVCHCRATDTLPWHWEHHQLTEHLPKALRETRRQWPACWGPMFLRVFETCVKTTKSVCNQFRLWK